jgi:hypothetical protein
MTAPHRIETLMAEVRRYLAAVETFRAEGCELRWLAEPASEAPLARRRRAVLGAPPIP